MHSIRPRPAVIIWGTAVNCHPGPLPQRQTVHSLENAPTRYLLVPIPSEFVLDVMRTIRANPELDMALEVSTQVAFRHLTLQYLRTSPEERRRRLRLVSGHFPQVASEVLGDDVQTMMILRDPVERTISLLRQHQRLVAGVGGPSPAQLATLSLEEVYEQPHVFDPLVHDHQTKLFSMTLADDPSGYLQVIDVDQSRLARAKETLATVDVIGLTERYDDFLDVVIERFHWSIKRDARLNTAPEGSGPVSDALRRRIAEDNAIDMELYEFARDLVADRRARRASG